MKRRLYDLLVPKSIKEKIYQSNAQEFEALEQARVCAFEASLPVAELSSVYLANLRVLTDQHALLHAMPANGIVGEIGVYNGEFSQKIIAITKPKLLHLIVSWSTEDDQRELVEQSIKTVKNKFRAEVNARQIAIHCGAPLAELERFDDHHFDWLYIDADRTFAGVTSLLDLCRQKVKPEGVIVGRNYSAGSVAYRKRYGVVEAVNRFCKEHGWELIYLTNEPNRNLSFAIRKMVDG